MVPKNIVLGATVLAALLLLVAFAVLREAPAPAPEGPSHVNATAPPPARHSDLEESALENQPEVRSPARVDPQLVGYEEEELNDFHTLLYAGHISRDEIGDGEYTRLIREKAKERCTAFSEEERGPFIARLCGFPSIDTLEAVLSSTDSQKAEAAALARQMFDIAELAADDFVALLPDAWDAGRFMEWDPSDEEPSVSDWLSERGRSLTSSQIRHSVTTRVGDRSYRFMFLSEDYPLLEVRIGDVYRLRSEFRDL